MRLIREQDNKKNMRLIRDGHDSVWNLSILSEAETALSVRCRSVF